MKRVLPLLLLAPLLSGCVTMSLHEFDSNWSRYYERSAAACRVAVADGEPGIYEVEIADPKGGRRRLRWRPDTTHPLFVRRPRVNDDIGWTSETEAPFPATESIEEARLVQGEDGTSTLILERPGLPRRELDVTIRGHQTGGPGPGARSSCGS